ncbi:hypothetical protein [Myroides guanonis]|uniref:Uncharacterized protein n=1 Tax=Myroides guanonis TaxID=1150112 RepID=A0A1I3L7A9_9FLAO|nr:hypothetical protein [Myroides guanonis]SFI80634.1 hypothetical protein SAMN04487893_101208 [Myroides guanonis]
MILRPFQFRLSLLLFLCGTYFLIAQTGSRSVSFNLSEVALLDVEPAASYINLAMNIPTEAGKAVSMPEVNVTKWLNYTSAIRTGAPKRSVSAQVDQLIEGVTLKLQTGTASGSGGGLLGTSAGNVVLTTSPAVIIIGIGGAYTGIGINNGHLLSFSLEVNDYKKLVQTTDKIITITYTISN